MEWLESLSDIRLLERKIKNLQTTQGLELVDFSFRKTYFRIRADLKNVRKDATTKVESYLRG